MKKFILTFVLVLTVSLSVYAADDTVLAEVIAVEYNSTILEVEKNTFKENEKVYFASAGESNGVITAVDGNIVIISLKNNGYAAGSKVVINNSAINFDNVSIKDRHYLNTFIDEINPDLPKMQRLNKDTVEIKSFLFNKKYDKKGE